MISDFPEAPESVALVLMQIIDEAEKKKARRPRSNVSKKERLLALYKDCLTAVTGLDCSGRSQRCISLPYPLQPRLGNRAGFFIEEFSPGANK